MGREFWRLENGASDCSRLQGNAHKRHPFPYSHSEVLLHCISEENFGGKELFYEMAAGQVPLALKEATVS